eukprot:328560_1
MCGAVTVGYVNVGTFVYVILYVAAVPFLFLNIVWPIGLYISKIIAVAKGIQDQDVEQNAKLLSVASKSFLLTLASILSSVMTWIWYLITVIIGQTQHTMFIASCLFG